MIGKIKEILEKDLFKKPEENLNNPSVSGTSTYSPPVSGTSCIDLVTLEQLESAKNFLKLFGYDVIKKKEEVKKEESIENLIEEYTKTDDNFEWKDVQCPSLYADPNNNGEFDVSKVLSILDSTENTDIHFTKSYCKHCGSLYFKQSETNTQEESKSVWSICKWED